MRTSSTLVGLGLLALAATARAQEAAPTGTQTTETAPPAGAASVTSAPTPPPELAAMAEAPQAKPRKFQLALSFLPMASGTFTADIGFGPQASDAAFAYGGSLALGYEILPGLSVGLAPQLIFNAQDKAGVLSPEAEKEIDLLARAAYTLTIVNGIGVYAEALPGYSLILLPSGAFSQGFVLAFGGGVIMDLTDRIFANLGVGYQIGFQNRSESGGASLENRTKYIRVAMGGGVRF